MYLRIIIVWTLIQLNLNAQNLTYEQTQDINFTHTIKNGTEFKSYRCEDGTIVTIGGKLKLGEPISDKEKTGDNSGSEKVYSFIFFGDSINQLSGRKNLPISYKKEFLLTEKLYLTHKKSSEKSTIYVSAYFEKDAAQKITIMDLDKAVNTGEILSKNLPITREEAIAKINVAKDFLDSGVIIEPEYETIKTQLEYNIIDNE
jgi:hypothetical protein